MKNVLFLLLLLCCISDSLLAQIYINGGTLTIKSNTLVFSKGDITNSGSAIINNDGTLKAKGNFNNIDLATLRGNGQYILSGNWINSANFEANNSTVTFEGTTNSMLTSGGDPFYHVTLAKTNADLLLDDDLMISHDLQFSSDNNQISIGNNDLTIGASATISNADDNQYVVTNGTGQLKKIDLGTTEFLFPVGFDATTYNPLTLVQSGLGIVDEYGVHVIQNVLEEGGSGLAITQGVADVSWNISEAMVGGSDLTLTAQWSSADELTGFDRDDSGISHYDGTGWDLTNAEAGMAAGTDPYTHFRNGVTELGYFAVGSAEIMTYVAVALKALLQGPYTISNHLMRDNLRTIFQAPPNETLRLIPLTEPYSALSNFTHIGRGGGETVSPSVFNNSGDINNDIVDWVFLELRDKNTSSFVLQTRAALIQRDGNIVDLDGISEVHFVGMSSDDYYIAVRHRNHLGVRTPGTLTLSRTATEHDFTAAMSNAYKPIALMNEPMSEPEIGVFALWGGNVNGNTNVRYSGPANDQNQLLTTCLDGDKSLVLQKQYTRCDINMNSNTRYSGPSNDQNFLLSTVLGGVKDKVIFQPTF